MGSRPAFEDVLLGLRLDCKVGPFIRSGPKVLKWMMALKASNVKLPRNLSTCTPASDGPFCYFFSLLQLHTPPPHPTLTSRGCSRPPTQEVEFTVKIPPRLWWPFGRNLLHISVTGLMSLFSFSWKNDVHKKKLKFRFLGLNF